MAYPMQLRMAGATKGSGAPDPFDPPMGLTRRPHVNSRLRLCAHGRAARGVHEILSSSNRFALPRLPTRFATSALRAFERKCAARRAGVEGADVPRGGAAEAGRRFGNWIAHSLEHDLSSRRAHVLKCPEMSGLKKCTLI